MVTMVSDIFLTVAEVALRLQVSEYTVREWLKAGRLPGYLPGGRKVGWRIKEADLQKFMDSSRYEPSTDEDDFDIPTT
jgi:excisionase family DNA binding protein